MQTTHVIVEGLVQGVCFREYTRRQAYTLQLTGWVRNLPDGSVEAHALRIERQGCRDASVAAPGITALTGGRVTHS